MRTAVDTDNREMLGIQLTPTRDGRDAFRFAKRVLRTCKHPPVVLVDGGPWYAWALHRMGVPRERVTFGARNIIEQWFSVFKQRLKRFYRRWLHNARVETVFSVEKRVFGDVNHSRSDGLRNKASKLKNVCYNIFTVKVVVVAVLKGFYRAKITYNVHKKNSKFMPKY